MPTAKGTTGTAPPSSPARGTLLLMTWERQSIVYWGNEWAIGGIVVLVVEVGEEACEVVKGAVTLAISIVVYCIIRILISIRTED